MAKTLSTLKSDFASYKRIQKLAGKKLGIAGVFPLFIIGEITGLNKPRISPPEID